MTKLKIYLFLVVSLTTLGQYAAEPQNGEIIHVSSQRIPGPEPACAPAKPCSPGVIVPVWQPSENLSECKIWFRAIVYLIALAYLFFGVSIVADRFMASIEVITSQQKSVKMKKITGEHFTIMVRVWNETVSNLTLMALGSSAPEILLSVIEICGNNFEAGELGPSTIVGSAAFNLFIIIAVCIMAIPNGETRRVQHNGVFWVTVVWSTFAYVWLYLILSVFSPGEVEVWEGVLTFVFFPLTVGSAYFADAHAGQFGQRLISGPLSSFVRRSPRRSPSKKTRENVENGAGLPGDATQNLIGGDADALAFEIHRRHYLDIFKQLRSEHPDAPVVELEKHAMEKVVGEQKKSRAFYRIQTTRKMIGSGDIQKKLKKSNKLEPMVVQKTMATVEFDPPHYTCLENVGDVYLTVKCDRGSVPEDTTVTVHYRTIADTAQAESDFVHTEGTITFEPGQTEQKIKVGIVDNDIYEDDEQFMVRLSQVRAFRSEHFSSVPARLGLAATATVIIVDDDHAGSFGFLSEKFKCTESCGSFVAEVIRSRGARGKVSIPYKTVDGAAKSPQDYEHQEGVLKFADEQSKAEIYIPIVNDDEYEKHEDFYIELGEPIWHRELADDEEGIEGKPILGFSRCKVVITEDREFKNFMDRALVTANTSIMVGTSSWKQQFTEAWTLEPEEEDGEVTTMEKVMHYIALPWKLLFALIPPTDYFNGWLCFVVAIAMIGLLTAFIGDIAAAFGCTVGLKDSVTALTLVAMGTSLPDTFASRTAAVGDQWADGSIGNVTGSNAVNVFLGIGIAWMIAACVHAYRGTKFLLLGLLGNNVPNWLSRMCRLTPISSFQSKSQRRVRRSNGLADHFRRNFRLRLAFVYPAQHTRGLLYY
ncbi:Calx-beta domain-containing protein [Caenorhabditis elegans]|uniref:Calx-beta domain-containing protein n=1 Tax=Caenorhabditis elegans TaxID=6239 RepID=Q1RPT9_CAEEL|nr:Calx-beta domain-containing protein [Caenorhabditis elegans]CAJ90511.1 Calx-beta domain-containing protein [Caenorhabditis elegans]|eukprot:NP_001041183.1 Na/Ca eXchangers [Caenorhabditis elegans]